METKIGIFKKTKHFMLRQYERSVSDLLLSYVLPRKKIQEGSYTLVISRRFIKQLIKLHLIKKTKIKHQELIIKVCGIRLITCYFTDFTTYLLGNKNTGEHQIIQYK